MRAIELVIRHLADAAAEGVSARATADADQRDQAGPKRRSRRPTTARAEPGQAPAPEGPQAIAAEVAPAEPAPVAPAPALAAPAPAPAQDAASPGTV
jgi:hypothetical protein